jgi:Polyketide cyclase / dehydrase and lipid transport
MMRIEASCIFPVSAQEAFNYITNLDNWPHYWPGFVRFEDSEHSQWGDPGGTVVPVIRLMGREVPLHITLQEFEHGRVVRYISQQPGLADAYHERHFSNVPEGCAYRAVVSSKPRWKWLGLYDRVLVRRAVKRTLRRTIANLQAAFANMQTHA